MGQHSLEYFKIFETNSEVGLVKIPSLTRPMVKEIGENNITIFRKKPEENEDENQAATPFTSFAFMDPVSGTLQKLFQVV